MRFYVIRSGRNNMSRLIARSIMFNTPKTNNVKTTNNEEISLGGLVIIVFIVCLIIL